MQRINSKFDAFRQNEYRNLRTNTASVRCLIWYVVILLSVIIMLETVKVLIFKYHHELIILGGLHHYICTLEYILRIILSKTHGRHLWFLP
jgi:hypothetical protein